MHFITTLICVLQALFCVCSKTEVDYLFTVKQFIVWWNKAPYYYASIMQAGIANLINLKGVGVRTHITMQL